MDEREIMAVAFAGAGAGAIAQWASVRGATNRVGAAAMGAAAASVATMVDTMSSSTGAVEGRNTVGRRPGATSAPVSL